MTSPWPSEGGADRSHHGVESIAPRSHHRRQSSGGSSSCGSMGGTTGGSAFSRTQPFQSSAAPPTTPPSTGAHISKPYKRNAASNSNVASSTSASPPTSKEPTSSTTTTGAQSAKSLSTKKSIVPRAPFPARAPPPPRSVAQLEEAMKDLKVYDSCLFWGKTGAVNLKPEGNSWDDDMVIQSKDPAWVRNYVQPPIPTNQELLILPPVAKIEKSIEVFYKNSHLYPPFITPLIIERAKQTRSNQVSRILLNTIAGIAIRIDPDIENTGSSSAATASRSGTNNVSGGNGNGEKKGSSHDNNRAQYMRYFNRAYGLVCHLEDIRSTYSTAYLQATLLLCYVYPKPQLRVELLKLMTEAAFLGLHVDCSRWMPRAIVIQNRNWLFWVCYVFDSVHHVVRGQLTQMDDTYLEAPFPALTEMDDDDGLWTRWFMLKEVNLWRIGRKIHSFFQAGLKKMDRLIEAIEAGQVYETLQGSGVGAILSDVQEVLTSEYSEAELVLSLKMWSDDLPARLSPQYENLDLLDPRVNGRAMGIQAIYSMLRILLLYPNMLAIGTDLLSASLPPQATQPNDESSPVNPYHQQLAQQQHYMRRQDFLDKIMQCVQEADRMVMLAGLILERYPERARMSCLGAALDWCLRIYHKVIMERGPRSAKQSSRSNTSTLSAESQQQSSQSSQAASDMPDGTVFSPRLKARCRSQVAKVAKWLQAFENLGYRHYFSWLTVELEALEEHQRAIQQRMMQRCLESGPLVAPLLSPMQLQPQQQPSFANPSQAPLQQPMISSSCSSMLAGTGIPSASSEYGTGLSGSSIEGSGGEMLMNVGNGYEGATDNGMMAAMMVNRRQQGQTTLSHGGGVVRPKMHNLASIIRKRQQMGIYARAGIQPNGGNYVPALDLGNTNPMVSNSALGSMANSTGSYVGVYANAYIHVVSIHVNAYVDANVDAHVNDYVDSHVNFHVELECDGYAPAINHHGVLTSSAVVTSAVPSIVPTSLVDIKSSMTYASGVKMVGSGHLAGDTSFHPTAVTMLPSAASALSAGTPTSSSMSTTSSPSPLASS
ncbi:hypothetical protein BGW38_004694, partial [Lunasporangiospora selenospora]